MGWRRGIVLGEEDDGDKKIALTHIAIKANGNGDGRRRWVVWGG